MVQTSTPTLSALMSLRGKEGNLGTVSPFINSNPCIRTAKQKRNPDHISSGFAVLPGNQFLSFLKGQRELQAVDLSVPHSPRERGTLGLQFLSGNVPRKDHTYKAYSPQYIFTPIHCLIRPNSHTERQIQDQFA